MTAKPPTPALGERREFTPGLSLSASLRLPLHLSDYRVAAFDMDSTLISIECIDELAAVAGRREEVSAITEAAMRGDIADYAESLRLRMALLRGIPETALERVWAERLQLNPGAHALVQALRAANLRLLLVSGGFTWFTERLQRQLGLDHTRANVLEVRDGLLTGEVLGPIVDAQAKADTLHAWCRDLGCEPAQAIAIGDGANDLAMMQIAGLSVAYQAKPAVRAQADVAIDSGGLDRLLEVFAPWRDGSLRAGPG